MEIKLNFRRSRLYTFNIFAMNTCMYSEILVLNFVHVECLFTLAGGAGYFYRVRHGKNTLAGVDEKFEHTLFTFVQMSTNMIRKVLTVWF